MYKLAILTPIHHIDGLMELLKSRFDCVYRPDDDLNEVSNYISDVDLVFTNPNSSKFNINSDFFNLCNSIKAIYTVSTGTNHIDLDEAVKRKIKIYSLTRELDLINQLSSTAELAFTFALMSTRRILPAIASVKEGNWNYQPFVGRQFSKLNIGVIGFGRLGKMFSQYCKSLGSSVFVFDPFVPIDNSYQFVDDLLVIAKKADVISLHVHLTESTRNLINNIFLSHCKESVTLVNTSRGEIVQEIDLINFLRKNPHASYYTDVLSDEISGRDVNPILNNKDVAHQIIVTPHIGGMSIDGQTQAFYFAANKLISLYGNDKI